MTRTLDPAVLREQTLGIDRVVTTPFGERLLVYADFTASGRQLRFVEEYLRDTAALYANSHTEDSLTGRTATHLLHEAEASIKGSVNAGPGGKVICCGTGSTAAIHKLQEILGIAIPPATARALTERAREVMGDRAEAVIEAMRAQCPVVFVGPYEHHSNEITWREGLAEVVEVNLTDSGHLDLDHLERLLKDERYAGRTRIGSFSAASNVTGLISPVRKITRLLHRHDALALFDYAAGGPYLDIDMNPEGDPEVAIDAVFLSPHKYIGGPGASGLLVFNEALYPSDLPPSVGGGGTVDYVGFRAHDFTADIEAREKAGTPGLFQVLRTALVLETQQAVGVETIHAREQEVLGRALDAWEKTDGIDILGPADPDARIGIVSFNVTTAKGKVLHPRFVTTLLCDLFGIQSRAGCSCAGPYGHRLLGIDETTSERYREATRRGCHGLKPGWCRVGFHFTMDVAEAEYVIEAVRFVAEYGARFLSLYDFDLATGAWTHRQATRERTPFSLDAALNAAPQPDEPLGEAERRRRYSSILDEARSMAASLPGVTPERSLDGDLAPLQYFPLPSADGISSRETAVTS